MNIKIFDNENEICPFLKINVVFSKPREFEDFINNLSNLHGKINLLEEK